MQDSPPQAKTQTAPNTEAPQNPLAREWRTYERELQRLIWEGYEGRFALIKGDAVLGVYGDEEHALVMGVFQFVPQPFLVTRIIWREPLIRPPAWVYEFAQAATRPPPDPPHPLLRPGLPTIHYTELPDPLPDHPLYHEERAYRRELPRLLREGLERKFGLFKGDSLIGIFDTDREALRAGYEKFLFQMPFLVTPILEYEPLLPPPRIPIRIQLTE
jgi:hypothetical protein